MTEKRYGVKYQETNGKQKEDYFASEESRDIVYETLHELSDVKPETIRKVER